jgi:hypothetical protein
MNGYLVIRGWSGQRKVPVDIVAETSDGLEIRAHERVFLPGRGVLQKGQSACVPRNVVKLR